MGDFEDEAATVPVDAPTTELALDDTAVAVISTIKTRAATRSDWPPEPPSPAPPPGARRHKKFYDAITASKLL